LAANHRFLLISTVSILLLFNLSQNSLAKVFEWKDFTQPFIRDFQVGGKTAIKVELPESVVKKNRKITLIIEHEGIGSDDPNSSHGGVLRINDQSYFSGYQFGLGMKKRGPIRLDLDTKYFRPGPNILHLSPYFTGGYRGAYYTIKKLRFDIPDNQKFAPTIEEQPSVHKKEKGSFKSPIAKAPKDKKPSKIIITSHDTTRGVKLVQEHRKTTIQGKVVDQSSIVEVLVDDKEAFVDQNGNFSAEVYLGYGENQIVVSAMDRYENRLILSVFIFVR